MTVKESMSYTGITVNNYNKQRKPYICVVYKLYLELCINVIYELNHIFIYL